MFRFANASLLWLICLVALLAIGFVVNSRRRRRHMTQLFGPKMLDFFLSSYSTAKRNWKAGLIFTALVMMVFALARPQMGQGQKKITSEGVELMMVVDVSKSMLAEDVKPSRMEHAKKEMSRLLGLLGGDKVGLIAFAGSPVLLSPMTTDKSGLNMFIESMSPDSVETQGTEIARALDEAHEAFRRGAEDLGPDKKMTQVVVLISDGEDHEEGAIKKATEMAEEGIRIFTLAFGSEQGGKIPLRDQRGLLKRYLKDKDGKDIVSRVNADLMRQIARAGKGSFYHVTFGGSHMKSLKEDIHKLEKSEFDSINKEDFDERYQIPLLLGLLLALFELFLGTRRVQAKQWRGRFVSSKE